MLIEDSETKLFVRQYGFDGLYIQMTDDVFHMSINLNKEQLHELYQYINACVSDQPIDDVLQYGA